MTEDLLENETLEREDVNMQKRHARTVALHISAGFGMRSAEAVVADAKTVFDFMWDGTYRDDHDQEEDLE